MDDLSMVKDILLRMIYGWSEDGGLVGSFLALRSRGRGFESRNTEEIYVDLIDG